MVIYGNETLRSAQFDIGCLDTLFHSSLLLCVFYAALSPFLPYSFCYSLTNASVLLSTFLPCGLWSVTITLSQRQMNAFEAFLSPSSFSCFVYRILLYSVVRVLMCEQKNKITFTPNKNHFPYCCCYQRISIEYDELVCESPRYMNRFHTWHHFLDVVCSFCSKEK